MMMAMGTKAIHCGAMGQGSTVKLVGNSVISFMLEALCEGVVLGRKAGIPLETIVEVIQASGYASPYYAFKGARHREARLRGALRDRPARQGPDADAGGGRGTQGPDAGPRRHPRGLPGRPRPGPRPRGHRARSSRRWRAPPACNRGPSAVATRPPEKACRALRASAWFTRGTKRARRRPHPLRPPAASGDVAVA